MLRFPLPLSPRYRPKYWSMECIEMLRKLLLTSGIGIVLAMGDSNCLGEYSSMSYDATTLDLSFLCSEGRRRGVVMSHCLWTVCGGDALAFKTV